MQLSDMSRFHSTNSYSQFEIQGSPFSISLEPAKLAVSHTRVLKSFNAEQEQNGKIFIFRAVSIVLPDCNMGLSADENFMLLQTRDTYDNVRCLTQAQTCLEQNCTKVSRGRRVWRNKFPRRYDRQAISTFGETAFEASDRTPSPPQPTHSAGCRRDAHVTQRLAPTVPRGSLLASSSDPPAQPTPRWRPAIHSPYLIDCGSASPLSCLD